MIRKTAERPICKETSQGLTCTEHLGHLGLHKARGVDGALLHAWSWSDQDRERALEQPEDLEE